MVEVLPIVQLEDLGASSSSEHCQLQLYLDAGIHQDWMVQVYIIMSRNALIMLASTNRQAWC